MSVATFDPSLPVDSSEIRADELRNQFVGLMNRCDALQANFDNYPMRPMDVVPLSLTISNPPTQAQVQAISNKLDELLAALQAV